jgi:hypothetical protein
MLDWTCSRRRCETNRTTLLARADEVVEETETFHRGLRGSNSIPFGAGAQVPSNLNTIRLDFHRGTADPFIASFRDAMRDRGYVEGQNIAFALQYAPGDPASPPASNPRSHGRGRSSAPYCRSPTGLQAHPAARLQPAAWAWKANPW